MAIEDSNGAAGVIGRDAGKAGGEGRLRGWKEIGRWFGADERTVKRWETMRGLPIHRVPGDARAPVFAYEAELAAWLNSRDAVPQPAPAPALALPAAAGVQRFPVWLVLALLLALGLGVVAWQGWRLAAAGQQEAGDRATDLRRLARSQVAELSDRLEHQPGTLRMRVSLVREAAAVLGRVAAKPDASPGLRLEAAEAYRRLAVALNATDRPSLRDRPAARQALASALRLVEGDTSVAGRQLTARVLIDAARQAAADGAVATASALLKRATEKVRDAPAALRDELALGQSEVAVWQGDYPGAVAAARRVTPGAPADADAALRGLRAADLAAEAHFYAGDREAALAGYRRALDAATAAQARWRGDPRFRWAVQRQQWNVGSTLIDMGRSREALAPLQTSRHGWTAMAAADPEDESVASWVRTARLSFGEALAGSGRMTAAIDELSRTLADRRAWLAAQPASAERRRALIVGLDPLAAAMAAAGRRVESCALYGEALAMVRQMQADDSLTRLDADALVKPLSENAARDCPRIDAARPFA